MEELIRDLKKITSGEIHEIPQVREILRKADWEMHRLEEERLRLGSVVYTAEQTFTRGADSQSP